MSDEIQPAVVVQTLRGLRAERRLLQQLLRLEVVREQAGGMEVVKAFLAKQGREPIDIDGALALLGVESVGERLVDLRSDIEALEAMLDG